MNLITNRQKTRLARSMQVLLGIIFLLGMYERNLSVFVNSGIALIITFLPNLLERDYAITFSPGILLWITAAVTLHTVGALGPYRTFWWYDHMTHTLSASIVGGVGYAVVQAINEYSEDVHLPSRFMFLFILLFTMAFGVVWELLEYLAGTASTVLRIDNVVTQYGLSDTLIDLLFDTAGAIIFAIWGTERVSHTITAIEQRFIEREQRLLQELGDL